VLIGGSWLHGKLGHPARLSLAGLRPLVLPGGILPPGAAGFTENADILSAFPWAEACEAKVRTLLLVLIGGSWLHGKLGHPARLSLAGLRPLVLPGGILPPGGSRCGQCGTTRAAVRSLPLLASCFIPRLNSDGVPLPASGLRKQAQPGWRSAAHGQ